MSYHTVDRFTSIDLSQLAFPDLMTAFEQTQLNAMVAAEFNNQGAAATRGALAAALLTLIAQREGTLREQINNTAQQLMLSSASGSNLDNLVSLLNVTRLLRTPADDTVDPPLSAVYESDDALRTRAHLALSQLSNTGSYKNYRFHALSAHPQIKAAQIHSPQPGKVAVEILSHLGDGSADNTILQAVEFALNSDDIRPMTDTLEVKSADIVHYKICATLVIRPELVPGELQRKMSGDWLTRYQQAAKNYVETQHRFSGLVSRSGIIAALYRDSHCEQETSLDGEIPTLENVYMHNPVLDIESDTGQVPYASEADITLRLQTLNLQTGALSLSQTTQASEEPIPHYRARPGSISGELRVKIDNSEKRLVSFAVHWGKNPIEPLSAATIFSAQLPTPIAGRAATLAVENVWFIEPNLSVPEQATHLLLNAYTRDGERVLLDYFTIPANDVLKPLSVPTAAQVTQL